MSSKPSSSAATRRITPADEVWLRRFRAEMKFIIAGPFAKLLSPIRPTKPVRDFIGRVIDPQPRYAPRSAESWTIGARLHPGLVAALESKFGREYGSVLDDEPANPSVPRPKRRRGRRGGRKVTS